MLQGFSWLWAGWVTLALVGQVLIFALARFVVSRLSVFQQQESRARTQIACELAQIPTLLVLVFLGLSYFTTTQPNNSFDRIYAYTDHAMLMAVIFLAYAIFSLISTVSLNHDHISVLIHHIASVLLATVAAQPFAHTYLPYYAGFMEMSSPCLSIMNIARCSPEFRERYNRFVEGNLVVFAILFLVVRGVLLYPITYCFCSDMISILRNGLSPSPVVLGFALAFTLALVALHVFWGLRLLRLMYRKIKAWQSHPEFESLV